MIRIKNIRRRMFILTLFLLAILLVSLYYYLGNKDEDIIDSQVIEERILSLGELTTLQYNYKNTLFYKDSKELKGIELPFTTKSFLVAYEGYIKAGVDLKNIIIQVDDKKNITLLLQEAKFTDNVINEEDVIVYDERSDLFNKIQLEDIFDLLEEEKKKTESQLRKKGFLKEANAKTQQLLIVLLNEMGFESIHIEFQANK